ncbi:MAG: hypothetical protein HXY52_00135 [Nitrospirae bacterium]|jgi:hypothetical protein|nr:hypothetical protein [Nitrospirota bacterium]
MKNLKITGRALIFIILLTLIVSIGRLQAEEVKTSGSASLDVMSNYVWRGQKLSNSWVIQPSVAIGYGVFGANIWANYDSDSIVDEGNGHGEFTETDITLSYTRSMDKWTFSAGYIYYALNNANDTQEIYLMVSYDTMLKPTLTIYYDFDEGNGAFITASIGHTIEVMKGINWNIGVLASYNINNKVMGLDKDGEDFSNFYNAEASTSLNIPVWKNITLTPKLAYSLPLSNDAKEAIKTISDDGDKNILYGGINLSLSF